VTAAGNSALDLALANNAFLPNLSPLTFPNLNQHTFIEWHLYYLEQPIHPSAHSSAKH